MYQQAEQHSKKTASKTNRYRAEYNNTGASQKTKNHFGSLSCISLDDARVHSNFDKQEQPPATDAFFKIPSDMDTMLEHEAECCHTIYGKEHPGISVVQMVPALGDEAKKRFSSILGKLVFAHRHTLLQTAANYNTCINSLGTGYLGISAAELGTLNAIPTAGVTAANYEPQLRALPFFNTLYTNLQWLIPMTYNQNYINHLFFSSAPNYNNFITLHAADFGMNPAVWASIAVLPPAADVFSHYNQLCGVITTHYNGIANPIGTDRDPIHTQHFAAHLGDPETPGTVLNLVSQGLLHTLFPPNGTGPYLFTYQNPNWVANPVTVPAPAGYTTALSSTAPNDVAIGNLTQKERGGLDLYNAIVTRQQRDVHIQRDVPWYGTGVFYQSAPSTVHLKSHSSRQDLIHEMGHHLEDNLTVEEFVQLHRFLAARSRVKTGQPDPGISRKREDFRYSAMMPELHLPYVSPLNPIRDFNKKSNKYATKIYDTAPGPSLYSSIHPSSTEYLSTTLELFTHENEVRPLLLHDPLRAALLLKFANAAVYNNVSAAYDAQRAAFPAMAPYTLDSLIHTL